MEITTIFYAVISALVYVGLQSLFIVGVGVSAKGKTDKMPNGEDYDSEMILFPLKKFLTRSEMRKVYFTGAYFDDLIEKIRTQIPEYDFSVSGNEISLTRNNTEFVHFVNLLNERMGRIDKTIQVGLTATGVYFYKVYEYYRFSKYLRKPIIQCPACMSSIWSIFSYWIPVLYVFGFSWPVLYLGIVNMFILVCLNWLIFSSRPH